MVGCSVRPAPPFFITGQLEGDERDVENLAGGDGVSG